MQFVFKYLNEWMISWGELRQIAVVITRHYGVGDAILTLYNHNLN
jgi:hypothetical protein